MSRGGLKLASAAEGHGMGIGVVTSCRSCPADPVLLFLCYPVPLAEATSRWHLLGS